MRIPALFALAIFLTLSCAAPAWAAEARSLDLGEQLNWWSIGTSIAIFLLVLVVLAKTAWKPILNGLQKREETIKKALDDAKAAHEQAKALITEYEAKIDKAREEAQAIFDETRRDAQEIRAGIEEDARKSAEETIARSAREIEQQHAKAWDKLVREAAAIAGEAAKRIIQKELSPEGHAEIVASVVSEFTTAGGGPRTAGGGEGA
jgi:F-type H+-transporting ATPase subunit b